MAIPPATAAKFHPPLPANALLTACRRGALVLALAGTAAACSDRGQPPRQGHAGQPSNSSATAGANSSATAGAIPDLNPGVDPAPAPSNQVPGDLPREYRFLLTTKMRVAETTALITRAAARAGLSFTPRGRSKCRLVQFLDVSKPTNWLWEQGFTLRLREKLDETCETRKEALAVSFNRRVEDREQAETDRARFAPSTELAAKNILNRHKHITAISQKARWPYYWVGGTVRKLSSRPTELATLGELFPGVRELEGYDPTASLGAVGGFCIAERNFDLGEITVDGESILFELAVWRPWQKRNAEPLAYELLFPRTGEPQVEAIATELEKQLREHTHWARTREALIYHLAENSAIATESRDDRCPEARD